MNHAEFLQEIIACIHLLSHAILILMATQTNKNLLKRITINPDQCGGRPCIRGMRIRVSDILDLMAAGLKVEDVLKELPDLEADDIKAAIQYASRKVNHAVLAA